MNDKKKFLDLIHSNIDKFGYHITIVNSKVTPRFAYSIGLTDKIGFELVFAGGTFFMYDDISIIFNKIVEGLKKNNNDCEIDYSIDSYGNFSLKEVKQSWCKQMTLGVFEYYKTDRISAYQIIPDSNHLTLDTPDMSTDLDKNLHPIWKWLFIDWNYNVPESSTVTTNLDALQGITITEVNRWEEDEWEMFAGSGTDVTKEEVRVVSLGTILGIDESLLPSIKLNKGEGIWREDRKSEWIEWK